MAWNPPAAFTNGAVLTAAQLNQIRDSLLETAVAKATTAGRFLVTNGLNTLVERSVGDATANGTAGTGSTTYLSIGGPTVTIPTGTSAMIHWAAQMTCASLGAVGYCSIEIASSSVTASDNNALIYEFTVASDTTARIGMSWHINGLTPGNNTFEMKYKSGNGAVIDFTRRHLWVFAQ